MDEQGLLSQKSMLLEILSLAYQNSPAQYHFVVIALVLEKIDTETRIDVKTTFVNSLTYLITNGKLAGMTIPELLEKCVKHLKEATKAVNNEQIELNISLVQAIGSLAINLSYPAQINEIISFLANRTQFESKNLSESDLLYLDSILESLAEVIRNNIESRSNKRISAHPDFMDYQLVTPILNYFQLQNKKIIFTLYNLVKGVLEFSSLDFRQNAEKDYLFANLRVNILSFLSKPGSQPMNYIISGSILVLYSTMCNLQEFGVTCLLLIETLKKVKSEGKLTILEELSFETMFIECLVVCSNFFSLKKLCDYMKEIKTCRLRDQKWASFIELTDNQLEKIGEAGFE